VNRLVARLVVATRKIDAAHGRFDAARSALLAGFLSDATLDHINDIAYASDERYRRDRVGFMSYLFPVEEAVWREFLPPPPARLLVGGAGGGREVAALVERGYEVVAFEPSEALAESLAEWGLEHVQVYRGAYEQLPFLRAVPDGQRVDIRDLGPFDAGLLGWGSFSHLRHEEHRVATLRAFGELTGGPVLVSFVGLRTGRRGANTRARLSCVRLPRREGRHPADRFSILMGFYHPTNQPEFEATARRAGMEVELAVFETRDIVVWPHVVIRRKENSGSGQEHDAVRPGASG
jgi:hypothetical protein